MVDGVGVGQGCLVVWRGLEQSGVYLERVQLGRNDMYYNEHLLEGDALPWLCIDE